MGGEAGARGAHDEADLLDAIREGAVLRVRPKAMTVAVILAGLMPIMFGGMVTAPLLSMFVVPAVYLLMRRRRTRAAVKVKW